VDAKTKRTLAIAGAGAVVLLVALLAFGAGHSCSSCNRPPPYVEPVGIDAGPGLAEIDEAERRAQEEAERRLREIEAEHQAELDAFDQAQRDKYEAVREMGPDFVADWLTDFNRSLRDAGQ
jgi:hypothetical protein